MSNSRSFSFAIATISAFFILFKADLFGILTVSAIVCCSFLASLCLVSLGALKPPNILEKKPFFLFSLLSLIIFA